MTTETETKARGIPKYIAHFHLYREERNPVSGKVQRRGLGAFLPADLGAYYYQPNTIYHVNDCASEAGVCIADPEGPDTTLGMLKASVDRIAHDLQEHGAACFESDHEARNIREWEEACRNDSDIFFNERGPEAECLACDVLVTLNDDYSELDTESNIPCEYLSQVIAHIVDLQEAYTETYGIRWEINDEGDVTGLHIMVAGGGPNIWVKTGRVSAGNRVSGYWGFDTEYHHELSGSTGQAILDHFEELAPTKRE